MISELQFEKSIQELELMFGPIENDMSRRGDKISIYYDRLKFTSERILQRAVNHLIDMHPWKRFPLVQEIRAAIDQAAQYNPRPAQDDSEDLGFVCEVCCGTGHALKEVIEEDGYKHTVASPCQCKEGRRVEARWEGYLASKKMEGR